jgi:hypothetical protein
MGRKFRVLLSWENRPTKWLSHPAVPPKVEARARKGAAFSGESIDGDALYGITPCPGIHPVRVALAQISDVLCSKDDVQLLPMTVYDISQSRQ